MHPLIATLLCLACIGYLFWMDRRSSQGVSNAVWIPFLWMFFAGSRFASQWWNLGSPINLSVEGYSDGSAMDRYVFLAIVAAGVWVLMQRRLPWGELLKRNAWVLLFFLFAALSVTWSDEPFVSFKRWVKSAGCLVMALVILTEERPVEALGRILRWLAFLLLPVSVLFIKYFPELGRSYHMGVPMFTGVSFQKNALGQLCMLIAIFFAWNLLFNSHAIRESLRTSLPIYGILLPMLAWLLYMAQSATALAITLIVIGLLLIGRTPFFNGKPSRLLVCAICALGLLWVLDRSFAIQDALIRLLGREPDLTSRKPLWDMLLGMASNRWVGAGFESFWSGTRLLEIWTQLGQESSGIIQAHNGYIDLYLNLGLVGVALLMLGIASGLFKTHTYSGTGYPLAILRMSFILAALAYNYTEAAFKPLNNVFVILLFSIVYARSVADSSVASLEGSTDKSAAIAQPQTVTAFRRNGLAHIAREMRVPRPRVPK